MENLHQKLLSTIREYSPICLSGPPLEYLLTRGGFYHGGYVPESKSTFIKFKKFMEQKKDIYIHALIGTVLFLACWALAGIWAAICLQFVNMGIMGYRFDMANELDEDDKPLKSLSAVELNFLEKSFDEIPLSSDLLTDLCKKSDYAKKWLKSLEESRSKFYYGDYHVMEALYTLERLDRRCATLQKLAT